MTGHAAGLEFHAHPLADVSLDQKTVEQALQNVVYRLDPGRPWGGQEPVTSVEKSDRIRNYLPNPSRTSALPDTTVTQWRITATTKILNMVGDSGSPYITPLVMVKGSL